MIDTLRRVLPQNADGLDPVHARHHDVDDHHVECERLDRAHRRVTAFGDHDAKAFLAQQQSERVAHRLLVVDHQNAFHQRPFLGRLAPPRLRS
jgi:hypothetical protein